MDSLISEAQKLSKINRVKSRVHVVADMMDDDLRAEFALALADRSITAPGLSKALKARGYELTQASIQHFREHGGTL
jgi:hypothetical protein